VNSNTLSPKLNFQELTHITAGTLYGALNSLLEKGWISPFVRTENILKESNRTLHENGKERKKNISLLPKAKRSLKMSFAD